MRGKHARVVRDEVYPQMWRVEYPDGTRSDMVNRARAKDVARTHNAELEGNRARPRAAPPAPEKRR